MKTSNKINSLNDAFMSFETKNMATATATATNETAKEDYAMLRMKAFTLDRHLTACGLPTQYIDGEFQAAMLDAIQSGILALILYRAGKRIVKNEDGEDFIETDFTTEITKLPTWKAESRIAWKALNRSFYRNNALSKKEHEMTQADDFQKYIELHNDTDTDDTETVETNDAKTAKRLAELPNVIAKMMQGVKPRGLVQRKQFLQKLEAFLKLLLAKVSPENAAIQAGFCKNKSTQNCNLSAFYQVECALRRRVGIQIRKWSKIEIGYRRPATRPEYKVNN